jgi:hypothetical protein
LFFAKFIKLDFFGIFFSFLLKLLINNVVLNHEKVVLINKATAEDINDIFTISVQLKKLFNKSPNSPYCFDNQDKMIIIEQTKINELIDKTSLKLSLLFLKIISKHKILVETIVTNIVQLKSK